MYIGYWTLNKYYYYYLLCELHVQVQRVYTLCQGNNSMSSDDINYMIEFITIFNLFFKNNMVEIVNKMSTLPIHIRGTDLY